MRIRLIFRMLATIMLINNSYAWTHRDMGTNFCNLSQKTIHFKKTYNYQANTNNDHSQEFTLSPQSCAGVDFWSQVQDNGYDLDNQIQWKMTDENGQDLGEIDFKGKTDAGIFFPVSRMRFGIYSNNLTFIDYPSGTTFDLNSNNLRKSLPFSKRTTNWFDNVKYDEYSKNKTYFGELQYDGVRDFHYGTIQITDSVPASSKTYEDYNDNILHKPIPVSCDVTPSLSVLPVYNFNISLLGSKASNQKISYMVVDKTSKLVKVPLTQAVDGKIQFSFQDPDTVMYCKNDSNCIMTKHDEYRLIVWGIDVNGMSLRTNVDFNFDSGKGTQLQKTQSDNFPSQSAGFYGLVTSSSGTPASINVTTPNTFGQYKLSVDNATGDLMYSGDLHWDIGTLGEPHCSVASGTPDITDYTPNGFNNSVEKKLNISIDMSIPYHSNYISYTTGKSQQGLNCHFRANAQFDSTSAMACEQF